MAATRSYPEQKLQASIVSYLRAVLPDCRTFAVPNGGLRGKREAARLKRTGVLAGVPDVVILASGGQAYLVEVKADKGSLSEAQKEFKLWMVNEAVPHAVVRSIDDVRAALAHWGVETREAA